MNLLHGIMDLIIPRTCNVCGNPLPSHSDFLCSYCMTNLPRVPLPAAGAADSPTITEQRLAGCRGLVRAASWLFYSRHLESTVLLADIKYRGCSRLARFLGQSMTLDLIPTGLFNDVDCIVPVPLHYFRQMQRGYNQSEMLARGVADILHLPVEQPLKARRHASQTRVHSDKRMKNVQGVYAARSGHPLLTTEPDSYRHILLIDDVCTTGATLTQVAETLMAAGKDLRISVLTLALTTSH